MATKLELLRVAVLAKAEYWDAVLELEKALAADIPGAEELSDRACDEIGEHIAILAAGLNTDDASCVTEEHLSMAERMSRYE